MSITIHWDFSTGEEISYQEGLIRVRKNESFHTHCTEFFDSKYANVRVVTSSGHFICLESLVRGDSTHIYTSKDIRPAHNLRRMLISGALIWHQPIKE